MKENRVKFDQVRLDLFEILFLKRIDLTLESWLPSVDARLCVV